MSCSEQLARGMDSHSRSLLSILLSKHNELETFLTHLQNLFARHSSERDNAEAGILTEEAKRSDGGCLN